MAKNLLIVESPAKAKTIEKYLGSDFEVLASYGHIRDLPKGGKAVDVENDFLPVYEVSPDKKEVVNKLRTKSKQVDEVWLATDEDREGEAISWHIAEVLGLNLDKTKRIVFHEITKTAIQEAVKKPRLVNIDLVNAQQARRVLDRLVGFEISPVLWKKVKFGLSAGRVQSVAVRLIVEREREVQSFEAKSYFKLKADFTTQKNEKFKAELPGKLTNEGEAKKYLEGCINAKFKIDKLEKKPSKRKPSAPFTTSTLQQEASRKLYLPVARTMRLAQSLYENGHITYMRTDSVNLSETALLAAKNTIEKTFGANYHQRRTYNTKVASAQEAHEAIRPTNFDAKIVSTDAAEQKLYDLIWKRALASQMADAELEKTVVDIEVLPSLPSIQLDNLVATGEIIKFEGFLKLYIESHDEEEEENVDQALLPNFQIGDFVNLQSMIAQQNFTRPNARYTEASLVKKLEELGIGRPSTYAPTIQTIIDRNYVEKQDKEGNPRNYIQFVLQNNQIIQKLLTETYGAEKQKLFPTDLGILVTDFLVVNFEEIVQYSFTAEVEQQFDEIAEGRLLWNDMLRSFYSPFHKLVEKVDKEAQRLDGERFIGEDPETGKPVLVRLGKYGPLVQIGAREDESKTFASLRPDQRMDKITLNEALELFKLPRIVGTFEGFEIKSSIGRFGPYLLHNNKFISLPKELSPYNIDEQKAIEVIEQKRITDEAKILKKIEGSDYVISKGRWGRSVLLAGGNTINLPKEITLDQITLAYCQELVEKYAPKKTKSAKSKTEKETATSKTSASKSKNKAVDSNTPAEKTKIIKSTTKSKTQNNNEISKGLSRKSKTE